jgi:hypothetical protein
VLKNGSVRISRQGKHVRTLSGLEAARFINALRVSNETENQILMARFTGNYKRGNERS